MTYLWRMGWKETREQMVFWVAILALTILLVVSIAAVFAPVNMFAVGNDETIGAVVINIILVMSVTYAVVCASLLFAGEREGGTQAFLDSLPASRMRIWSAKVLTGLALVLTQTALLFALGMMFRLRLELGAWWLWLAMLFSLSLTGYGWGLFASVRCRTVLGSAGISGVFLLLSWVAAAFFFGYVLFFGIVQLGLAAGAVVASQLRYCNPDWQRTSRAMARRRGLVRPSSVRVLLWLCWRQGWIVVVLVAVAVVPLGILFLWHGLWLWPIATLVFGLVCGTEVFAGEQPAGTYRFLGEQRFPHRRVWLVKVLFWLMVAVGGAALLFFIGVTATFIRDFVTINAVSYANFYNEGIWRWLQQKEIVSHYIPFPIFLTAWLSTGFAIGLFFSQIFRKPVVSLFLSIFLSAVLLAVWLPSLLMGGLAWWKLYLPLAVLLVANLIAMRSWVSDRLLTFRPLLGLSLCGLFVPLWVAGCIWYRVASIPDVGEPFNVQKFAASLHTQEGDRTGEHIREAVESFKKRQEEHSRLNANEQPEKKETPEQRHERFLDFVFQGDWLPKMEKASRMPLGTIHDPRHSRYADYQYLPTACEQLTERAGQILKRGQTEKALDYLLTCLRLTNHLRNKADANWVSTAEFVDANALQVMEKWLKKAPQSPKLLRRLLDALQQHEKKYPPLEEAVKVNRLTREGSWQDYNWNRLTLDGKLFYLSGQVPWEKARDRRIVNLLTAAELWIVNQPFHKLPDEVKTVKTSGYQPKRWLQQVLAMNVRGNPAGQLSRWQIEALFDSWFHHWFNYLHIVALVRQRANELRHLRQLELQTARKLYEAEQGKAPQRLQDLVPRYLPQIPEDPFTGQALKDGVE